MLAWCPMFPWAVRLSAWMARSASMKPSRAHIPSPMRARVRSKFLCRPTCPAGA